MSAGWLPNNTLQYKHKFNKFSYSYARAPFYSSGGSHKEVGDKHCTHMVVEENSVTELPFTPTKKLFVVKQEVRHGIKA